jgi:hypothetical protein
MWDKLTSAFAVAPGLGLHSSNSGSLEDRPSFARITVTASVARMSSDIRESIAGLVPHIATLMWRTCRLRAQRDLLNWFKLMLPVQSPLAKIFLFSSDPNHFYILRHPGPHKGAFRDRHERKVGMRWTRAAPKTRALPCGRRSRVVLTPRRWRQVLEKQASWGRRWQTSPVAGESAK